MVVLFCMSKARAFVPRPRRRGVVSQDVDGETLLYVEATHQALALNAPASRIWHLLDAERSVGALSTATDLAPALVLAALRQLSEAGLLENGDELPLRRSMTRRRLLADAALAAIPVVLLIVAPGAAEACSTTGCSCTTNSECRSGHCRPKLHICR